jgi:Tol biopolymer transport system component
MLMATSLAPVLATYPGAENGRIAFGVRAADNSANIFTAEPDGTGLRQLTHGAGNNLCAAYSADGQQIAYCSDKSGAFEIWAMKQNGKKQHQVTHLNGFSTFPDFSPNGSRIAFGSFLDAVGSDEIYVVNASNGLGLTQLTDCPGVGTYCMNAFPAWSPNGRQIAFIHAEQFDGDGNPLDSQVWVMDANGGNKHALTTDAPFKDQVPDWSPDGTKIAYASGPSGIWVMNADGTDQHQLSGCGPSDPTPCATGDDFGPAWSPDGTKIAFLRAFQGLGINSRPVFVMNADGSDQHQLIAGQSLQAVPSWQARGVGAGN